MFDTTRRQFRGEIKERHVERFSDSLLFKSDVRYLSDKEYYRDFGGASGEYNLQKTESTAFMVKYWDRYSLTGKATYIQDLQAADNRGTLQTLPSIVFSGMKQQLWRLPLYVSADTVFANFFREEGLNGQRVSLHPQLTFYLGSPGALQLSAWGGYQQRFYNTYGDSASEGGFSLGLADAGAQLSASFDRIFELNIGALRKIRHQLVPEVSYLYVQNNDQDRLPFFDYDDRIVGRNTVTYGLSNYLVGRFDGDGQTAYRTLLYLRVSQGYSPGGIRQDYLNPVPETRTFGAVRVEARSNPLPHASFFLDSRYEPSHFGLSSISSGGEYRDDGGNHVGASYYFARNEIDYLEGRLGLGLIRPFSFDFAARYSLDKRDLLESYYALEYKHQCWSVNFTYRDRPGNKEFLVNFTLAGVGVKGPVRAF
jgi:LPS-assembly protein